MINLKNKSKVLSVATVLNIIAGAIGFIQGIKEALELDDILNEYMAWVFMIVPVIIIFKLSLLIASFFEIKTALKALKTNKISSHIWNFVWGVVVFLGIGLSVALDDSSEIPDMFFLCMLFSQILRPFGYFNQKKIDKRNKKEEN